MKKLFDYKRTGEQRASWYGHVDTMERKMIKNYTGESGKGREELA